MLPKIAFDDTFKVAPRRFVTSHSLKEVEKILVGLDLNC